MNNLILIFALLLFLLNLSESQTPVRTTPQVQEWTNIFNGRVGAGGDGIDTTSNISIKGSIGVGTLCIEVDTTSAALETAQRSDSCLGIGIQYYCSEANAGGWGPYYNNIDTYKVTAVTNFTLLDTLDRLYAAKTNGRYFIDLGEFNEWAWADYARFFLFIGYGDSLYVRVSYGGQ